MEEANLENFYETWSGKGAAEIKYDIEASVRKADILAGQIPNRYLSTIRTVLDFGCGYGAVLRRFCENLQGSVELAIGVDYSQAAIDVACQGGSSAVLQYHKLPYLNISDNRDCLLSLVPKMVDAVLLIDLLEHVPNCKQLIAALSEFGRLFILKLPIESSVFDNYFLPKEYPSSVHSNGHLREFDANSVHYFVRSVGLTPLFETLYIYHPDDTFPPLPKSATGKQRVSRMLIKGLKSLLVILLPKKLYLRLVGGGGYICIATYSDGHVLNP